MHLWIQPYNFFFRALAVYNHLLNFSFDCCKFYLILKDVNNQLLKNQGFLFVYYFFFATYFNIENIVSKEVTILLCS